MKRKIGMVLYWGIGFVFIFLAYVIGYNSGASNKYYELLNNAVDSNNHLDVARVFSTYGIPLNSKPVYESKTETNDIVIYCAINQANLEYKNEDNKTEHYAKIEFMYYFFIYNPSFDNLTINNTTNLTGLKFYNSANESFKYNFFVNENVNKEEYKDPVTSPTEAMFNVKRDVVSVYADYKFIFTYISELFMENVNNNIGDVTKLELIDSNGNVVGNPINISFDFSEQFYQDMTEFRDNSRIIQELTGKDNSEEDRKKLSAAEDYVTEFNDAFKNGEYNSDYVAGYPKDAIYNAKLVWSSIGIASLFAVVLALVFILIFYFKRIKNWAFGDHSGRKQRIVPNKINRTTPSTESSSDNKTSFDRVNEQRKIDLEKKRAREEAIRKSGNVIVKPQEEVNKETKEAEAIDAEIVEEKNDLQNNDNNDVKENNELKEESNN